MTSQALYFGPVNGPSSGLTEAWRKGCEAGGCKTEGFRGYILVNRVESMSWLVPGARHDCQIAGARGVQISPQEPPNPQANYLYAEQNCWPQVGGFR